MNKKSTQIIVAIIVLFVGVGIGWAYAKSSAAPVAATSGYTGTFAGRTGGTGGFAGRTGAGGGAVVGTIVSVDPTSISVALPNSTSTSATTGSTVVLYSDGTNILKSIVGSSADLQVGDSVVVQGTANSDGSVSANTIQIRPTQTGQ